eukprot:GILJ01022616.1.p1 GENE.GILJ01022616.1~~GILJ01022616.1.p1  ORF type:complete len:336 (-),score=56.05 GILJ01022616.1:419-1426(-)
MSMHHLVARWKATVNKNKKATEIAHETPASTTKQKRANDAKISMLEGSKSSASPAHTPPSRRIQRVDSDRAVLEATTSAVESSFAGRRIQWIGMDTTDCKTLYQDTAGSDVKFEDDISDVEVDSESEVTGSHIPMSSEDEQQVSPTRRKRNVAKETTKTFRHLLSILGISPADKNKGPRIQKLKEYITALHEKHAKEEQAHFEEIQRLRDFRINSKQRTQHAEKVQKEMQAKMAEMDLEKMALLRENERLKQELSATKQRISTEALSTEVVEILRESQRTLERSNRHLLGEIAELKAARQAEAEAWRKQYSEVRSQLEELRRKQGTMPPRSIATS